MAHKPDSHADRPAWRRMGWIMAALLAVVLVLAACGGAQEGTPRAPGGTPAMPGGEATTVAPAPTEPPAEATPAATPTESGG